MPEDVEKETPYTWSVFNLGLVHTKNSLQLHLHISYFTRSDMNPDSCIHAACI